MRLVGEGMPACGLGVFTLLMQVSAALFMCTGFQILTVSLGWQ